MRTITYRVVKHDGGWAYEVNGTYSEPYPTRDDARTAAQRAAAERGSGTPRSTATRIDRTLRCKVEARAIQRSPLYR